MSPKKKLAEICHKVYAKGFVVVYEGNISARHEDNTIIITSSDIIHNKRNI
jgi:ribulose-5-phosphate 4-epimerase/fuculose-1-phosphate aldolase